MCDVPALGVGATRLEEVWSGLNRGIDAGDVERIGGDDLGRDVCVDDLIDERRVGAVLQQAPHQIGKQVLVSADWGVDPAARDMFRHHQAMEHFSHPVQALKFEGLRWGCGGFGHSQHRFDRLRVVGGELRV